MNGKIEGHVQEREMEDNRERKRRRGISNTKDSEKVIQQHYLFLKTHIYIYYTCFVYVMPKHTHIPTHIHREREGEEGKSGRGRGV